MNGRLPLWSASVPQNIGAVLNKTKFLSGCNYHAHQRLVERRSCPEIQRRTMSAQRQTYTVTVKLINSTDFENADAMVGMAGKYMLEESGLGVLSYERRSASPTVEARLSAPKEAGEGGQRDDDPFVSSSKRVIRCVRRRGNLAAGCHWTSICGRYWGI
jgi:hypothetical protein